MSRQTLIKNCLSHGSAAHKGVRQQRHQGRPAIAADRSLGRQTLVPLDGLNEPSHGCWESSRGSRSRAHLPH
jgi:hypothetical protein